MPLVPTYAQFTYSITASISSKLAERVCWNTSHRLCQKRPTALTKARHQHRTMDVRTHIHTQHHTFTHAEAVYQHHKNSSITRKREISYSDGSIFSACSLVVTGWGYGLWAIAFFLRPIVVQYLHSYGDSYG